MEPDWWGTLERFLREAPLVGGGAGGGSRCAAEVSVLAGSATYRPPHINPSQPPNTVCVHSELTEARVT